MEDNNKTDKILEAISEVKITLARHGVLHEKNTEDLAEHIRRTELLESRTEAQQMEIYALKTSHAVARATLLSSWKTITIVVGLILGAIKLIKDFDLL